MNTATTNKKLENPSNAPAESVDKCKTASADLKADTMSDSWLSRNIRPLTLVYILTAYLIFAVADGFGFKISESYVQLLGQWGMLVMTAYFSGRSVEKIVGVLKSSK